MREGRERESSHFSELTQEAGLGGHEVTGETPGHQV
jgi:hypothetical protein